eukprot:CAMPEP_0204215502 /NCGR_PEP_ID=MMETSP0361-20130328/77498_1 /ASSEMBLY_ACC=CAM_ASM_000343 /TAXON_ID=268821 /ORGANISM="Scrippsiella Hangoei, Strain SHTV-5" /LENGTH=49 /DNA_ID= /DNA_START= /DNA_END= /DNA_ORIENTATION=
MIRASKAVVSARFATAAESLSLQIELKSPRMVHFRVCSAAFWTSPRTSP